jgi:DNA-binding CsgD family transcriptional regulator
MLPLPQVMRSSLARRRTHDAYASGAKRNCTHIEKQGRQIVIHANNVDGGAWVVWDNGFEAAWAGGASLTRAELEVVERVSEGLGNKEVAARLFVYAKLGLTSRVQLAQETARSNCHTRAVAGVDGRLETITSGQGRSRVIASGQIQPQSDQYRVRGLGLIPSGSDQRTPYDSPS